MRPMLVLAPLVLGALGCACAGGPTALDYFPVSAEGYWLLEGDEEGRPLRIALRGAGLAEDGSLRLDLAWQGGAGGGAPPKRCTVRRREGFLELVPERGVIRLLPDDPAATDAWEWDNDGHPWRGRIRRRDGFQVVPLGRYADVLEVEVGPAGAGAETWRWHFVVGVGPIAMRATKAGGTGAAAVDLVAWEPGTRVHVPRADAASTPSEQPAAPAADPAEKTSG